GKEEAQIQRHLKQAGAVFLIEIISEIHAFFCSKAQERKELCVHKGFQEIMVQHGAEMVEAEDDAVPADIAFRELIGGAEFEYRIKTDVVVIHDGCRAQKHRNQEGAGAFQKSLAPAQLPVQKKKH